MLLLTSPSNRQEASIPAPSFRTSSTILARHERVLVLADEIYEHINFTALFHLDG